MTSAATRRPRKPFAPRQTRNASGFKRPRLRLPVTIDVESLEAAERFQSLPPAERRRRLEAFRKICAPAFQSVDDYLAWKRRENADED